MKQAGVGGQDSGGQCGIIKLERGHVVQGGVLRTDAAMCVKRWDGQSRSDARQDNLA
jgi:hypothetical protein